MDDFSPYDGNDFRAWLDSLNPADRKRENIALARYHDKRQRLLIRRQLQPEPRRAGPKRHFAEKTLIEYRCYTSHASELATTGTIKVPNAAFARKVIAQYLGFDWDKDSKRLNRIADGRESAVNKPAETRRAKEADQITEKLVTLFSEATERAHASRTNRR